MSRTNLSISLFIVLATLSGISRSADRDNKFAVKSVGATDCQRYLAARKLGGSEYALYGGYIGGFVSAYNQLTADTFDISPWQNMDTLAGMLASHCERNTGENFALALNRMIGALKQAQLDKASISVEAKAGDGRIMIYEESLRRAQTKLAELGIYKGLPDGRFGPETETALKAFQEQKGLQQSGLPDQITLFHLSY
ncbi:MAG: peptidoglycan-binding protein [Gammaproteobacteria bacterium]|nr:peptidoglycan-binding protein [Gammaproteobacteria bacterium]